MAPQNRYLPLPPPLATDKQFFRVLILEPGQGDEQITCNLETSRIPGAGIEKHTVVYDAVSYAFGREYPQHDIIMGAWTVSIRENLWYALHQFRLPTERRRLWIDALCINQLDLEERASQVQMMDRIYNGARRVLVWLGPADENSGPAMNMIQEAAATELVPITMTSTEYIALLGWSDRAYWKRTWVVQEFLLASDLTLLCGNETLSWTTLERFMYRLSRAPLMSPNSAENSWSFFLRTPAYQLMQQRVAFDSRKCSLTHLLIRNRLTECHIPRDRVYAMLGLTEESNAARKVPISYTMDDRSLLFEVIRHTKAQPKDMLRWTKFLKYMLQIDYTKICLPSLSVIQSNFAEEHALAARGFVTSKIINCLALDELSRHSSMSSPIESGRIGSKGLSDVVKYLSEEDFARLKGTFRTLERRTRSSRACDSSWTDVGDATHAQVFIVVAFAFGCVSKRVLGAAAYGNPIDGKDVVQFLGSDMALTVHTEAGKTTITGCLLFARPRPNEPVPEVRDVMTHSLCNPQNIQSEADCIELVQQVDFLMTPDEILALAL